MNLRFIIRELGVPVITCFGLALAIPYVIAHSILPLFFTNPLTRTLIARQIYPFFLLIAFVIGIVVLQVRQFKNLYVAIKNDKYLVGQRLVNYDHQRKKRRPSVVSSAAEEAGSESGATAADGAAATGGEQQPVPGQAESSGADGHRSPTGTGSSMQANPLEEAVQ
uniref:RING-type E3 ubiquitin transferase n=1 Tax=Anopheles braziliensis TaxID=58242 RepID=A0A2M3ZLW5_9DIPT